MTERDSTSEPATPQARQSIVGYRPNHGQPDPYPQITLKGRWLGQLGFTTGQKLEVITQPGQLIIRLATEA
ncbi:type I toxin-antitoxin system SymE family toxin [Rahnella sp. BCC 1045]|uniref:SymE family type I addiction module toxin n=1 Tax=unclassified Rahnella TaxID=2635087 RepID=UPI001AD89495|nr:MULTISPECIES: SymE family type I addiction module toxin [unclassified Rahnella]MBU9821460.1 type I toxin-antitoxin system SymE family toxin [Rahnella sp. BCC 1045]